MAWRLRPCAAVRGLYQSPRFNSSTTPTPRLSVGDTASVTRTFTASDVTTFSDVTGDANPLHVDAEYARQTTFGRRIVHGTLTLGLVSGLVAGRLPGPGSVLLRQAVEYPAPLYVDEQVTATVELLRYRKHIARLALLCTATEGKVVLKGNIDVLYEQS